jgi:hypothetical protein
MRLFDTESGQSIELPDDLLWVDEHAWTAATANIEYLLTGALLIESAARQAGRPITLVGAPDMAWVQRSTVNHLHEWAQSPDRTLRLELTDGRAFVVRFRHADGAIEAEPVLGFPTSHPDTWYRVTLRLLEADPAG